MKRSFGLLTVFSCSLVAGVLLIQMGASGQKRARGRQTKTSASAIREEKGVSAVAEAPPECSQLVRDFIAYISHEKPDIASDKQAQGRWLSDDLRKELEHRQDSYKTYAKKNPDSPEGPPGNGDFVGSWDYPTTYMLAGSRRYENRVIVDVMFKWGANTQYPGDTRLTSYVLVREGNAWKLDDIYTLRSKFAATTSLSQTFNSDEYP
jgi:hypothetical protein